MGGDKSSASAQTLDYETFAAFSLVQLNLKHLVQIKRPRVPTVDASRVVPDLQQLQESGSRVYLPSPTPPPPHLRDYPAIFQD